jgi:glycosyltransferase involved in cell wall biosynthesis
MEDASPDAGSISASLRGLSAALESHGITVETHPIGFDRPQGNRSQELDRCVGGADVVHVFGWSGGRLRHAARAAIRARKRLVITPFGALDESHRRRFPLAERIRERVAGRKLLRAASALTAINEFERHAIGRYIGSDSASLLPVGICTRDFFADDSIEANAEAALYEVAESRGAGPSRSIRTSDAAVADRRDAARSSPVDATVAQALSTLAPGRLALVLGPIDPIEGLVPMLKAFAELGSVADAWNIAIAGPETGPWRNQLEAATLRKGAADRVCFTTASQPEVQRALLRSANLLLCTPLAARCPISVLQGLAARVPVIATHFVVPSGLESAVRVCAPTRPEIRNALREMLALSDEQRAGRAAAAYEASAPVIDWSAAAIAYSELYQRDS